MTVQFSHDINSLVHVNLQQSRPPETTAESTLPEIINFDGQPGRLMAVVLSPSGRYLLTAHEAEPEVLVTIWSHEGIRISSAQSRLLACLLWMPHEEGI
jgi:hypothetical protein